MTNTVWPLKLLLLMWRVRARSQYATLANWCRDSIAAQRLDPAASVCQAGPQYARAVWGKFGGPPVH